MKNMWDERFASKEYIYGEKPNHYLTQELKNLKPGKILFPGEGEGRNAVFAALQGWETYALDSSIKGQEKALALAQKNGVNIHYDLVSYEDFQIKANEYDCIALIYTHNPIRNRLHQKLIDSLKPGGHIILEGFSKNQLKYNSGGPNRLDLLYSIEEIKEDFKQLKIKNLEELIIHLEEGNNHSGESSVIRLLAQKI